MLYLCLIKAFGKNGTKDRFTNKMLKNKRTLEVNQVNKKWRV